MIIFDEDRPSESPFVERVWHCHSEGAGPFLSIAQSRCELVVTKLRGKVTLPEATSTSFWLGGSAWQVPDYDNADTFADWLVREGLLLRESIVGAALQDQPQDLSLSTIQRRFLRAIGVTQSAARQIERARSATLLLQQGVSILDTTFEAGYFDQPHLTRSLKQFIGQTPAQILQKSRPEQLPFLYKTTPFC